jgi:transposase
MDQRLFPELPETAPRQAPAGGRPRLRTAERRQVELRALSLDQLIAPGHRVRLVWRFVEGLDLAPLHAGIKALDGRPGHPPADTCLLVALWLYATVEGVASAPALARLCREHLAFQWLCGGVGMNHTTLAEFRVAHGAVLEGLLVDSFAALLTTGVASLERVAQDGVRVRAAAGAGVVPPPRDLAGLPSPGQSRGRAAAPEARARSRCREPPPGRGAPAGGGGARAPGQRGPGADRGVAGRGAGRGRQAHPAICPSRCERRR